MAINWGPARGNFRLGMDVIGTGTHRTWILYGQSVRYGHNWSYTIDFTGAWGGGSKSGHFSSAHNQTKTVELHRSTRPARTETNGAILTSVLVNGAQVSRQNTYTPPAPDPPSAPSGLTITRQSDSVLVLNWTRNSTYTSVLIDKAIDGGSWRRVATVQGNAYTWTDRTTGADHMYQYRVRGVNAGGTSGLSNTATAYTTPGVPSDVQAVKLANGDIRVTAGLAQWATSYDVQDEYGATATSVQMPWTDSSPNITVPHRYRVRSKRGSLVSGWSGWSNTIQLAAPPNAPTGLSPNGSVRVADEDVVFAWQHNPVDSSEQTAFEVRYRELGGSWVTISGGEDSTVGVELYAGDFEWQVRTKGVHADWSPWSSVATVEVIDRPGVVIVEPADGSIVGYSVLDAEWTFQQTQGFPQASWRAELLDTDGVILEQRSGSGPTAHVLFQRRLDDDVTYTLRVQAAAGGIWSEWDEATFTTDFPLPGVPDVNVSWDDEQGMHLVVFEDTVGDAGTVEMLVERSFDGDSWVLISDGHEPGEHAVEDYEGVSNGVTFYRVTAVSGLPSTAEAVFEVESDSGAVWLSGGPGFTTVCRLPYNPQPSRNTGRETTLRYYSGRSKPVVYKGKQLSRVVDLVGDVLYDDAVNASYEELEELAHLPDELHLYRDPDGQRMYGALGEVSLSRQSHVHWSYSASITEADR